MIGRTDPAAALAARLMDTGNNLKDSEVVGGFATIGDVAEEEGDVVGAVLGVSSSGDSVLFILLGVSSSGVSFGCSTEDPLGFSEGLFSMGDSMEAFVRGLEAFFVGDSSGASVEMATGFAGAVVAFAADAVAADAVDAGAGTAGAGTAGAGGRATGVSTRGRGAVAFCTIGTSDSFPMVSRYSCEARRDGESE